MNNYITGVFWFLLSLVISVSNDVIARYVSGNLHFTQISFFRFLFSTLTLLPLCLYYGKDALKTSNIYIHLVRGALLFFGISTWIQGLSTVQVAISTVITFTIPLFVLILAIFFLNEKIAWYRWIATILGFVGIFITVDYHGEDFNPDVLILLLGAILFAILDIINKKFVLKESMLSMLFYSSLVTVILSFVPAINNWKTPNFFDLSLLFTLGAGANLILYCLLKAFALVDATAIAPYRYFELLISTIAGYVILNDIPPLSTWYGAGLIIPTTLFIAYSEIKEKK